MEKIKIVKDLNHTYGEYNPIDIIIGFDKITNTETERKSLLGIGPDHSSVSNMVKEYKDYFKMFFIPEEPNAFVVGHGYNNIKSIESEFDLIFSICKYTNEWREKYFNSPKRMSCFYPYSTSNIFPSDDKEIDVYFTAHMRPSNLISYIHSVMEKFPNHKIIDKTTFGPVPHDDKMKFNGKSRISIVYNLLFTGIGHYNYVKTIPHWKENAAFSHMNAGLMPQLKTRTFDAAFSKTVILNKRDPWNIIEDFFEPEKEFIYYDTEEDLEEKINEILKNYGDYYHIAENAYNRAMKDYTTERFIEKYILPNTKLEV